MLAKIAAHESHSTIGILLNDITMFELTDANNATAVSNKLLSVANFVNAFNLFF